MHESQTKVRGKDSLRIDTKLYSKFYDTHENNINILTRIQVRLNSIREKCDPMKIR